jgi:hypothetical protein
VYYTAVRATYLTS